MHVCSVSTLRNLAKVNEDRIDMDLLEHVVLYIHETQDPGAILVFVPGMAEIDNLSRRLLSQRMLQSHVIVPLHSSISPRDQKRAFKVHPPGIRKIVISTNIAETSVTIEDIVYVVDTGKLKERRYDASRSMSMLIEDSVSVANANQRKGRAGRVREGTCYSLYTRACFEGRMKKYQVCNHPSIQEFHNSFLKRLLHDADSRDHEGSFGRNDTSNSQSQVERHS